MDDDQQFCLRWNNHQSTLVSVFDTLLEKGMHVDCTLAAEGQTLKAHKVVLSACSPYFESVLSQQYDKHPIIILKDVKYAELRAMMDYMYRGEVNISQDQLAALLKAAESLQIKGLSDNKPSRPPSRPPPVAPPAHTTHPPHPPRPNSPTPPHQPIEGSIDSREGSVSPTRRRKKARRTSLEALPLALPIPLKVPPTEPVQGNGEDVPCKEEQREGVEDLTIDEDADEPPPGVHNDVVRSFQWHMDRSQDELMNSSDSIRDSQDEMKSLQHNIVTRSKKSVEEPPIATTFAVLKTVKSSQLIDPKAPKLLKQLDAKENKTLLNLSPPPPPPPPLTPKPKVSGGRKSDEKPVKREPYERREGDERGEEGERVKEHKCPNCRRSYNARRNLLRHISLECGREPQYKCPYCSFSRHRRNELKNHLQKKHPNLYTNADMKAIANKKDSHFK